MVNENALIALQQRYFMKDEDGKCIEDWKGLCERVSSAIAKDEKPELQKEWAQKYFDLIYNLYFLPNTPTLMNAGKSNGQLAACVSGDTYIMTDIGLKEMSKIQIGDFVLTHTGRFKKVTNKWYKGYEPTIGVYRTHNSKRKIPNGYFTPDHKILQNNNEWHYCEDAVDAKLPFIDRKADKFPYKLFVENYVDDKYILSNGKIFKKNIGDRRKNDFSNQTIPVNNEIINDNQLAWLFGIYISEGNIDHNCIRFTLHEEEKEIAGKIYDIIKDKFGISCIISYSNHGKWQEISCHSKIVMMFFDSILGKGFSNKRIPNFVYYSNNDYIDEILNGIHDGDSYCYEDGNRQLVLANPSVIYQCVLLSRMIGKDISYHSFIKNKLSKSPTSRVKEVNVNCDQYYNNKDTITHKHVYDIEVEEDHSFVAADLICHNCFVLPIDDDMKGIMKTATDMAIIHKSGGGTGFDFSKLRPCKSRVKTTSGVASGPVSFMRMYSNITQEVKQGGARRGASLGLLRVDHPDILEFVDCKQDTTQITNFNISVGITDKFMECVEQNKMFDLIDPKTKKSVNKVNAKELFDKICKNCWNTGEPGLFFLDTVNKKNLYGEVFAPNPCVTGDTLVATFKGNIPIKELAEKNEPVIVYSWNPKTKLPELQWMRNIRKTREKVPVLKVTFDSGLRTKCTYDHSFYTFRGDKIQAKNLKIGQRVRAFSSSEHVDGHIRLHGWVNNKTQHIWEHRALWQLYYGDIPADKVVNHINNDPDDNRIENLCLLTAYQHNSHHYPERFKNGFTGKSVVYTPELRKRISESLKRYYQNLKAEKIVNHKVINIEFVNETEDVYNGEVDNCHTYVIADEKYCGKDPRGRISGVVSANCAESPLLNNESCNLGSMNLHRYIEVDDSGKVFFNFDLFLGHIVVALRFLDSVISINCYPIPEIKEATELTRKVGLGVMGFADTLIELGIIYGSEESIVFASRLMETVDKKSKEASEQLGIEKGICEICKQLKINRRNLWTTVIAPTGSLSIIAGVSSGIEPLFAVGYTKNVLDGKKLVEINRVFVQKMKEADIIVDSDIESSIVAQSIKKNKLIPKKIRELFVTAHDLSYEIHIKMQSTFQQFVDGGISKTINFSKEAKVEDIYNAFLLAYKSGCKGITAYRDGSRPDQVLSTKKDERKVFNRTTIMKGETEKIKTTLGNLMLTINRNSSGQPGEVILNIGKSGADITAFSEALGRLISVSLQHGVSVKKLADQLKNIKGEDIIFHNGEKYTSIPDLIGKKIESSEISKEKVIEDREAVLSLCPECSARLYRGEGCLTCQSCGYSKC